MKRSIAFLVLTLCLGLAALDADAARRFGGGGNLGRQRPAPTMREAPREAPAAAPAPSRSAQPTPAPGTTPLPAPRPSFMQRWGGVLTGLGIGALLGSLFGGHLGGAGGALFLLLIVAVLVYGAIRLFARGRGAPPQRAAYEGAGAANGNTYDMERTRAQPGFSGIGSAIPAEPGARDTAVNALPSGPEPTVLQPGEVEPFLRVAKTSFIRLQAANDAGDLDDIRDYTTPEMYAEIAMQVRDRHGSQKTEVVALDAELVGTGVEDPYAYASVRFKGALRETPTGATETFDEVWNVRRKLSDPRSPWLIAGIQQAA
ncbi:MAG TPA: TIM44-like domain-containing protein [Usitatibacter sp.]|nr:TIM44-like domain-containing protein [Usitatibacter sp.]